MTTLYKIVYSGHLSYGFTEAEARQELARRYRFSDNQLDRLFSAPKTVLKKGVGDEAGRKLVSALREAGVECDLVEDRPEAPTPASPPPPSVSSSSHQPIRVKAAPRTILCPKCNTDQPESDVCCQCGLIFKKYQQLQERVAEGRTARQVAAQLRGEDAKKVDQMEMGFFERHPEKAFLLRAAITVAGILALTNFAPGLVAWFFFLFPLMFLLYIRFQAAAEGVEASALLKEHITFMPLMYAEGERKKEGAAWVTYLLILINILIFYGYEIHTDPNFILDHLCFPPRIPTALTLVVSSFSSFFLHANNAHLWGNMVALWVFGTVVERRIGWQKFFWFYMASGLLSGVISFGVMFVAQGDTTPGLGASGAIAGVMGLFAVRCYFKSVIFPIPILGFFSLIFPVSLKMRLNSLVLIGLFFIKDLYGGVGQATGAFDTGIGHWAHLGGTMIGIGLAYLFHLGADAVEEKYLDQGLRATAGGKLSAEGEESLRKVLETSPENIEALTALARARSKYATTEEGEALYQKAIGLLMKKDADQAADLYAEYYKRYLKGVDARLMYRLASVFHRKADLSMASQVLTLIVQDSEAAAELREKALFQNARVMEQMGDREAAKNCYTSLVESFPASELVERARAFLALPL